jgi:hypothetical protein
MDTRHGSRIATYREHTTHILVFCLTLPSFESLLPAPIAFLEVNGKQGVYVVPDLVDFIPLVGVG